MPVVLVEAIYGVLMAAGGAFFTFWLCRRGEKRRIAENKDRIDSEKTRAAMEQLNELANRIRSDVGSHSSRVEEISKDLAEDSGLDVTQVAVIVRKLLDANRMMQDQLTTAEEKLREQARQIQVHLEAARTDALTGLANRRAFDDELERRMAEFERHERTFSLLLCDVDHFKRFNDTHGHQAGDMVLQGVARVLSETMRKMDQVSRYGGEEFAVVMPGTDIKHAQAAAERARRAIERARFEFNGAKLKVTASVGVAEAVEEEAAPDLIKRTDDCLYRAKAAGRNNSHWHDGTEPQPISKKKGGAVKGVETKRTAAAAEPTRSHRSQSATAKTNGAPAATSDQDQPQQAAGSAAPPLAKNPLDALPTREMLLEDIERRLAAKRRGGADFVVAIVQIDRFGELREKVGDDGARTILRATNQFLRGALRDMDLVARYDEQGFGIVLPNTGCLEAARILERIRNAVARCQLPLSGGRISFTISGGAGESRPAENAEELTARIETLIADARSRGGNATIMQDGDSRKRAADVVATE